MIRKRFSTIVCAVAEGGPTTGLTRFVRALRQRPAQACAGGAVLALAISWRRFLDGRSSPFVEDIEHYHHPVTRELARAWSEGRIPLWTDHVYFGFPYFADPQTAAWYPPTLLVVALGPHTGYIAFLLLHSLLAVLCTLGLVRSHGGSWSAAWASGLVLALSGYYAHEIQHPGLFAILAWLPAWLWSTHAVFRRPTSGHVATAALVVAMMIFAGTLQVLFGAAILYAFYVAGLITDALRWREQRDAWRALGLTVVAQVLGLLLAGVVLVPATAHLSHTARTLGMMYEFGSMGSVHPVQLLGLFVNGAEASLRGDTALDFGGASFYVGALALPLALVGLTAAKRAIPIALALAVALIAALAMGRFGWLHPLLYDALPGTVGGLRGVGRALGPATVCIAVLAGLGLHRLGDEASPRRFVMGLVVLLLACHAVILALAPGPVRTATLGSAGVLAAALGVLVFGWRDARRRCAAFAALLALDLVCFGALDRFLEIHPAPPEPERLAGALPALDDLAESNPDDRVLLAAFPPWNLPMIAGVDGVGGYNPLVELQYLDFVHLVNFSTAYPREPLAGFVHGILPVRPAAGLFDAGSIRFVISDEYFEAPGMRLLRRYPAQPPRRAEALVYENVDALPRSYLAFRTARADGPDDYERLLGRGFDPRRTTVIEGDARPLAGPAEIAPITAVRERPESLHFDIETRYPAILVVTDSWYPGWRAWVDGEEFPVLRVNALFRGVSVAAGARRVEMHFDPLTFRVGTTATAAAALAIGFLLFVATVRTVRPLLRGITWLRPRER